MTGKLKSDYIRIEMKKNLYLRTHRRLKSDYIRIEIKLNDTCSFGFLGLKSDYIRIEICVALLLLRIFRRN